MSLAFTLDNVRSVVAYKRDQVTTDLLCMDVEVEADDGTTNIWTIHEERPEWLQWLSELETLDGFDPRWFEKVSQPPFAASVTEIFRRPVA